MSDKKGMKNTSINIPIITYDVLDLLVRMGVRPSRSWIIRESLIEFIPKIIKEHRKIVELISSNDIPNLKKYMESKGFKVSKDVGWKAKSRVSYVKKSDKVLGNIFYDEIFDEEGNIKRVLKKEFEVKQLS
jgi:Arc/MetJ-type ribon-helix-helix transcriptional regulator